MRKKNLLIVLILLFLAFLTGCQFEESKQKEDLIPDNPPINEETSGIDVKKNIFNEEEIRNSVIDEINNLRLENNLTSMIYNENLENRAEKWALYLKNTNSFETNEFEKNFAQTIHTIPYSNNVKNCRRTKTNKENVECLMRSFENSKNIKNILSYNQFGVGVESVLDDNGIYNVLYVFYFNNNLSTISDTYNLNFSEIRDSVSHKIKKERENRNLHFVRRNYKLDKIADIKAEKLINEGFHHTDEEGKNIDDILKENNFFYITAGENLFYTSLIGNESNEYLGNLSVSKWLESPGHRSLVLNRDDWLYSDMGIGLSLDNKNNLLNFVLIFVTLSKKGTIEAEKDYCYTIELYDKDLFEEGVFEEVDVNVIINSKRKISKMFLVDDSSEAENCWDGNVDDIKEWRNIKNLNETLKIKKGYSLLLRMKRDSEINYVINYIN